MFEKLHPAVQIFAIFGATITAFSAIMYTYAAYMNTMGVNAALEQMKQRPPCSKCFKSMNTKGGEDDKKV